MYPSNQLIDWSLSSRFDPMITGLIRHCCIIIRIESKFLCFVGKYPKKRGQNGTKRTMKGRLVKQKHFFGSSEVIIKGAELRF